MIPRVDVVIPTRGRDHLLPALVVPLLEDPIVNRIIVVDDAHHTGTVSDESALSALSPRVEVICTGGAGPAKAREAGAQASETEVLLFLDDDVMPEPGIAALHSRHHGQSSELLVCGYTPVIPRPGCRLSPEATVYSQTYEMRRRQYETDGDVVLTHLWGGNFSLRRDDALRVGLASESFSRPFHEDRDFGLRCREAGLTAVFDPAIQAGHLYERQWSVVAKESFSRGDSLVLLHQVHSSVLGPFDPHQFEQGMPRPLRMLVRAANGPLTGRIATGVVTALGRLGTATHLRFLQINAVRLLRRTQAARGAHSALLKPTLRAASAVDH